MELQVAGGSELCLAGGAGQGPGSVHLLVVLLQQLRGLEVGLLVKIGYVVLALHHGAEEGGRERRHGRRLFEKNILTDYHLRINVKMFKVRRLTAFIFLQIQIQMRRRAEPAR